MDFNGYQGKSKKYAKYSEGIKPSYIYPVIGLAGETGEVCEKIKKKIRGG